MFTKILIILLVLSPSFGEDYYELLGLKRNADQKSIRQAFKKIAVTHHPDKNNDDPDAHIKFVKYTTAYEILKDPETRKKYDLYGEEGVNGNNNNRQQNYHSYSYYQNNFGMYDDDPEIVTLNRNDYHDNVINSEKVWMINFYSAMCGHCHHLAPIWRKIAKDLEGVIRIGAVNCEDDWSLCHEIGIQSYPTLLYYPKNSKHGIRFTSKKSYQEIMDFVMERLDVNIEEITSTVWKNSLKGIEKREKSMLVFICGDNHECFDNDDQIKITAILENILTTGIVDCYKINCNDISSSTTAVFIPGFKHKTKNPIYFDNTYTINDLVHQVLDQLPEPQEITSSDFKDIQKTLENNNDNEDGWLICFYMGHATEFDVQLKRLPSIINDVNLGKLNCGKYSNICRKLNINRYPMWGVLKPGGAFELSHGKDNINDIAKFAENSIKAKNVWALTADKILSILKRQNNNEAWFIDWYAPWCPPCIQFLPEIRKASLEFDKSTVYFGTVDCTVHSNICQNYNIRSYPTAMLINGTTTSQFTAQKTATNIIEFINESINPTVIRLNSNNFYKIVGKKKTKTLWVIDYFAPWCGPCQQLAPEWINVAKALKKLPNIKIASIDCEANSDICRSEGVKSYPNIRLYPIGSEGLDKVTIYNGPRDSTSMIKWITEFLPIKIIDLNDNTLNKKVFNSKNDIWLVDFFAPWCGHCQKLEPHFNIAAQLLNGQVKFARVNCDLYKYDCGRAGVRAYPSLILYDPKNKKMNKIDGKLLSAFTAEQIEKQVLNHLNFNYDHDEL